MPFSIWHVSVADMESKEHFKWIVRFLCYVAAWLFDVAFSYNV